MDHRHAVFDRDRLPTARLHIDIAARQNGKDQRLLAVDQMTAIELGADRDGQSQLPHRRFGRRPVRNRSDEIAAEPDENLCASVDHRLDRVDDTVPASPWWLKAKYLFYLVEEFRLRVCVDAHSAVASHVRVAAHRADPRSRLPEISAQ